MNRGLVQLFVCKHTQQINIYLPFPQCKRNTQRKAYLSKSRYIYLIVYLYYNTSSIICQPPIKGNFKKLLQNFTIQSIDKLQKVWYNVVMERFIRITRKNIMNWIEFMYMLIDELEKDEDVKEFDGQSIREESRD